MRTFLLALTLSLATPALAGSGDAAVITGVVAVQQEHFEEALAKLDAALASPELLESKNVPKAHFYRAKARLGLLAQVAAEPDAETRIARTEGLGEEPLVATTEDFLAARAGDPDRWGRDVDRELEQLSLHLLQAGVEFLNASQARKADAEAREALLHSAIRHLDAAIAVAPDRYMAWDLRGQARFTLAGEVAGATAETAAPAYADFLKATELYASHPPAMPDLLIGYLFYRLALIARYQRADPRAALAHLQAGRARVEAEHQRLRAKRDQLKLEQWARVEQQYDDVVADLRRLELDTYLQIEDRAEAVERFARAVQEDPKNARFWLAYASLLESEDPDRAVVAYQTAFELDPSQATAPFNLGALYVNRAAAVAMRANETEDPAQARALMTEVSALYAKATPWLEKAHERDPQQIEVVRALKGAYLHLERTADYERMKALERQLTGG